MCRSNLCKILLTQSRTSARSASGDGRRSWWTSRCGRSPIRPGAPSSGWCAMASCRQARSRRTSRRSAGPRSPSTCGCWPTPGWSTVRPDGNRRLYRWRREGLRDAAAFVDEMWSDRLARLKAAAEREEWPDAEPGAARAIDDRGDDVTDADTTVVEQTVRIEPAPRRCGATGPTPSACATGGACRRARSAGRAARASSRWAAAPSCAASTSSSCPTSGSCSASVGTPPRARPTSPPGSTAWRSPSPPMATTRSSPCATPACPPRSRPEHRVGWGGVLELLVERVPKAGPEARRVGRETDARVRRTRATGSARLVFQRALGGDLRRRLRGGRTASSARCSASAGCCPIRRFVARVPFRRAPSVFHLRYSDRSRSPPCRGPAPVLGRVRGRRARPTAARSGVRWLVWLVLWALYLSIVNVGQTCYGVRLGVAAARGRLPRRLPRASRARPAGRWCCGCCAGCCSGVEFGAGLIKLRGDRVLARPHLPPLPPRDPADARTRSAGGSTTCPMPLHRVEVGRQPRRPARRARSLLFAPQPVAGGRRRGDGRHPGVADAQRQLLVAERRSRSRSPSRRSATARSSRSLPVTAPARRRRRRRGTTRCVVARRRARGRRSAAGRRGTCCRGAS